MNEHELRRAAEKIELSSAAKERIIERSLHYAERKGTGNMSGRNIRRTIIMVAAAMMLLSVSAYAMNGAVASWGGRNSVNDYTFDSMPAEARLEKELGYVPAVKDTFENGYTLSEGVINWGALWDESGNTIERYRELGIDYAKDGDKLFFSARKFNTPMEIDGECIAEADGVQIRYNRYTNKVVPEGYELTEEDRAAEASGKLVFSYGSDSVSVVQVQGVNWKVDGVLYGLTQIDGRLSREELAAMAKELLTLG